MQHVGLIELAAVYGSLALVIAFMLTLWPGRRRLIVAAVLYSLGFFATMLPSIYLRINQVQIGYGLTDGEPNRLALLLLLWPLWATGYPLASAATLYPSIPHEKALRWGKFLHILIGLPPILIQVLTTSPVYGKVFALSWLAYVLLWFRIREKYTVFA